ncbi:MAG TPA: TonB family protein [Candidatus Baltobacteraceae bacterium]|jgi:TonB family protein|nr:TonB family protein [Candidatus Baltobacteraceae bacterium]
MTVATYQLKSELARVCLPAPDRDAYRRLAWTNSVCIFFLIIGVVGARSRLPMPKRPPPIEQPIPVIIEPLVTPPSTEVKQIEPQNEDQKEIAPRVVAVTLETPAIDFSVPTIGNLLVPISAATAPPVAELRPSAPVRQAPTMTGATGDGGDRPEPPYPELAQQLSQQGTVLLVLTVDDVGAVTSVSVKESSGSALLDRTARDWIKRRWIQPPINGSHVFQVAIHYKL